MGYKGGYFFMNHGFRVLLFLTCFAIYLISCSFFLVVLVPYSPGPILGLELERITKLLGLTLLALAFTFVPLFRFLAST